MVHVCKLHGDTVITDFIYIMHTKALLHWESISSLGNPEEERN